MRPGATSIDGSSLARVQDALNHCKKLHDTCEIQATIYGEATVDMDTFLAMKPDAMNLPESVEFGLNLKAEDVPACKELIHHFLKDDDARLCEAEAQILGDASSDDSEVKKNFFELVGPSEGYEMVEWDFEREV